MSNPRQRFGSVEFYIYAHAITRVLRLDATFAHLCSNYTGNARDNVPRDCAYLVNTRLSRLFVYCATKVCQLSSLDTDTSFLSHFDTALLIRLLNLELIFTELLRNCDNERDKVIILL